jgi:hypothetical protein
MVDFSGTNVDYQGLIRSTRGLVPLRQAAHLPAAGGGNVLPLLGYHDP